MIYSGNFARIGCVNERKSMKTKKSLIITLALITIFLVGCTKKSTKLTENEPIKVVTTTDFYADIAKSIGGSEIDVHPIIKSNAQDPHDFEPTTKTAKEVSDANLIISNGLGYDDWIDRLENISSAKSINIGKDVLNLKAGANPHLWFNLKYMEKAAAAVELKLSKMRPAKKELFKANLEKFDTEIQSVQNQVNRLMKDDFKSKVIYTSEPVFDYPIQNAGLEVGNKDFERAIEREIDPSAKVIANMKENLKAKKVNLFIYNKQVDNPIVQSMLKLAKENEVNVLSVTETKPANITYLEWMNKIYQDFAVKLKD